MKRLFLFFSGVLLFAQFAHSAEILGDWKTECVFEPKKHSTLTTLFFTQDRYSVVTRLFATTECEGPTLEVRMRGSFGVNATNDPKHFDHLPESVGMILLQQQVVDFYNRDSMCGFSDWVLNEEKDVSGRVCTPHRMPAKNQPLFDIFSVERGRLRFGGFPRAGNFSAPSERPTRLSDYWVFVRASE